MTLLDILIIVENKNLTAPNGTKTRISRCTDIQALPVDISMNKKCMDFSDEIFDRVKMNGVDRSDRVRKEDGR